MKFLNILSEVRRILSSPEAQEIWESVKLFLSKAGIAAYRVAKEVVQEVVENLPEAATWSDEQRRDYVVKVITERLTARYGDIPGFAWVVNFAVQLAVGWLRQEFKGDRA